MTAACWWVYAADSGNGQHHLRDSRDGSIAGEGLRQAHSSLVACVIAAQAVLTHTGTHWEGQQHDSRNN